VAAIVVYFRTPELLSGCLESLRRQSTPPDEIVVVDNSSAIDGLTERPAAGDDWRWIRAERNLGFGAACNVGARASRKRNLLFLNADVMLDEHACKALHGTLATASHAGAVGPRIYDGHGTIELSARSFPTAATALVGRSSLLTKALGRVRRTPAGVSAALRGSGRVDWISGACMLVRREAFEEVGGFDEEYWMYWEDADICRRLKDHRWDTMLCTTAHASHSTGSSGKSPDTIEAFHKSAARYYERHVARSAPVARVARGALHLRMRIALHRHAAERSS
jgi:GT2 family glycosyltransferase